MEEGEIRTAEIKKTSYEFERDIVKGAINQVSLASFIFLKCMHMSVLNKAIDAEIIDRRKLKV